MVTMSCVSFREQNISFYCLYLQLFSFHFSLLNFLTTFLKILRSSSIYTACPCVSNYLTYSVQTVNGNGLEGSSHHGVLLQHLIEVIHRQRVEPTVSFRSHAGRSPAPRQQTDLWNRKERASECGKTATVLKGKRKSPKLCPTSKIRAVGQFHCKCSLGDDAAYSVLDEVHLFADGALPYDVVLWLENLKT